MAKIKSVTSAMSMKATMKPSFAKKRSGGQASGLNLSIPSQKKGKPSSPMKKSKKGSGY